MCGVNDFKHALTGRQSPAAFHADLIQCVHDIKRALGDDVWVILPGMPMQLATIFPPPLRYLAVHASDAWDAQKRKLCDAAARVRFVPSPSSEAMQSAAGAGVAMVAVDGIHPNDAGYGAWAHHIAKSVAPVLLGDGAALCEEGGEEGGGKEEEDGKEEEEGEEERGWREGGASESECRRRHRRTRHVTTILLFFADRRVIKSSRAICANESQIDGNASDWIRTRQSTP